MARPRWGAGARVLGLVALVSCSGEPDSGKPDNLIAAEAIAAAEAAQAEERAKAVSAGGDASPAALVAPIPGAEPVEIVLIWQGIGNLHRSWFSSTGATRYLTEGFAGRVVGPANVYVRHDNEKYIGSIRLQLRPDTLKLPVAVEGDVVSLSALAPLTVALASYRSHVSGNYDLRVQSFSVGIESIRGAHSCIFGLAGQPPPDGSLISPCVQIDGAEVCGVTEPGGVRFPAEAVKTLKTCLDL